LKLTCAIPLKGGTPRPKCARMIEMLAIVNTDHRVPFPTVGLKK
jgi:hypothetical protein